MNDDSLLPILGKAAPAVGGSIWTMIDPNTLVAVLTAIYVLAQIGLLVPRYVAMFRRAFSRGDQ